MTSKTLPELPSIAFLMFKASLYKTYSLRSEARSFTGAAATRLEALFGRVQGTGPNREPTTTSFCPECKVDRTFTMAGARLHDFQWDDIATSRGFHQLSATCTHHAEHVATFFVWYETMTVTKVGQYPSVADIAIEETRQKFRKVLKGANATELYKAIGLYAHGEGIGSFVYLRRIFERLIKSRFDEFKDAEGWQDTDYNERRMHDKVGLLKNHLPPFLVTNKRIYSIFSVGIHELDNDACLGFFEVGKQSILTILQEDLQKREEMETKNQLEKAISSYQPPLAASTSTDNTDDA